MEEPLLKNKAVTGVIWTTVQRFSSVFLGFISSIILARLLAPEDYGCIGMLSIFMVIASAFIEGGFGSALVQKKSPTQEDYTTVFYWNLFVSVLCYIILFFAAPAIAKFYHLPLLCKVLRIQGVVLIINAIQTVHVNQMYKQFRFKRIAIIYLINVSISMPITILMAYKSYGVWTLVAQNIMGVTIPAAIYWTTNHWFPSRRFSIKSFKELFNFGFYILLSSLFTQIIDNIQGLLIGRLYNPARMGFYSKAQSTQSLATQTITNVVSQVSYPLFSEVQDDLVMMANVLKKINTSISLVVFPLVFLLILIAPPLFILLYSEKWLQCVPYFQILCLSGIPLCLVSASGQSVKSLGLSKTQFRWGVFTNIFGLSFVILGLVIGKIEGMLLGMVLRSCLSYFISSRLVSKYVGYTMLRQLADLSPILLLSLVAFIFAFVSVYLFEINMYIEALIELIIFILTFFVGAKLLKLEAVQFIIGLAAPIINKILKK